MTLNSLLLMPRYVPSGTRQTEVCWTFSEECILSSYVRDTGTGCASFYGTNIGSWSYIDANARRPVNKRRERERGSENERGVGCFESGRNDSVGLVCAGGRRAAGARGGRRRAGHSWGLGWPGGPAD